MQTELLSLLVIAVIAAAAPLVAGVPRSVRVPVVVVEILAGILVGPHVLDLVSPGEVVTFLSATGLAFLFFLAGMEIDFLAIRGKPATLGLWGWIISLGLGSRSPACSRREGSCSRPFSSASPSRRRRSAR